MEEVPLLGGDVTDGVVRVGGTVRRPQGPHSPLVHAVLAHLESVGFAGAPRFLGVDGQDREVLTFVEGEVAGRPYPAWTADLDVAVSVAVLLRRLDDAMVPFGLPDSLLTHLPDVPGAPAPAGPPPTFVGHRDACPENVVLREGRAVALIDFDLAAPTSRVDEVATLLLWWAPWQPAEDRQAVMRDVDAAARGRVLVDAYGLDDAEREVLVEVARVNAARAWHGMRHRAEHLGGGWARMWAAGVGEVNLRRQEWLAEHAAALDAALRRT